jgi:hypothetical protein
MIAAFISPVLFYGGAAAVAAPILIHLLARRRFKRIRWAAMDFLLDAERRNRRRLRMEEWILLALRCLAVLFIAALISRPFFKPTGAAAILGGSRSTERVFVLDDSLSMAYETADGTVFDRAKQVVRRLVESIQRQTPDDTVTLLRMSAPAAPVESGTYLDGAQTDELLARLDALRPSQRAVDPSNAIEGVAEVLERNETITSATIYIVSDFQRAAWTATGPDRAPGSARSAEHEEGDGAGIAAPLAAWAGDDRGLRLVLINVGEDDAANMAVTELAVRGGRLVAGTTGTVRAKVANYTSRSVVNLELELAVGNRPQPSKTLRELAPRQIASVDLEAEFLRPGFDEVRVELAPDALPADNVRYVAADVAGAIRVLIVNGEPSADGFDDEVGFLATALRPEGDVFSGNEVVIVDEAELDETSLSRFHVVVLANVYRVSDPAVESLERFARRGGGVLFFLGDQVDADLYNTAFYRNGDGLLPAELTEVVRGVDAAHLVLVDRLHPAVRGLGREGDPLGLTQVPFFEYFACVPFDVATPNEPGAQATGDIVNAASQAERKGREEPPDAGGIASRLPGRRIGQPAPRRARVIARFDDADEHPAIVERPFGQGRAILVTTSADKEWHQWPDHPTFLPVMMELVRHVAHRGKAGTEHLVGNSIELLLDPAEFEPDTLVRTPAYPNEREVVVTATPSGDGRGLVLNWEHTETAGIYQFVLKRRQATTAPGTDEVRLVAVNVDPRESDLTLADEDALRSSMGQVPFEYVKGMDKLAEAADEARTELWRLFLFAAVAVLMVEQSLAWFWGRGR